MELNYLDISIDSKCIFTSHAHFLNTPGQKYIFHYFHFKGYGFPKISLDLNKSYTKTP